jgi:hypothetical protein
VARSQAVGSDEYDLTTFTFDPILDSAGRRFVFLISCATCASDLTTTAITGPTRGDAPGNLVVDGQREVGRQIAFVPIHDRLPPASRPATATRADRPGPGQWRITTSGGIPSLVVVGETYFPGWKATVDGKAVPVFEADGAFVGIPVPAGDHLVELTYERPPAAIVGRLITGGTILAVLVLWWRRRRQGLRHDQRRSGPAGHHLEVRTPPAEPDWQAALDPEQRRPRPPIADREGPGGEGDEAVLPGVDDLEAGRGQQLQQRRRPKP